MVAARLTVAAFPASAISKLVKVARQEALEEVEEEHLLRMRQRRVRISEGGQRRCRVLAVRAMCWPAQDQSLETKGVAAPRRLLITSR